MARTVRVHRAGREGQPIAIVDDFTADPDALRAAAGAAAWSPAKRAYPGLRAPLPTGYVSEVAPLIADILRNVFGLSGGARVLDASFSLVTSPPDRLTLEQRLPHVDAVDAGRIALVHYLTPGDTDGTAFFRHRATGYETITAERSTDYLARLNADIRAMAAPPEGYIADDTTLFERTELVETRFNRAVLYRSAMLHSGAIAAGRALLVDPLAGRLTVTAFLAAQ